MLERDDGFKNDAVGNKRQERERESGRVFRKKFESFLFSVFK